MWAETKQLPGLVKPPLTSLGFDFTAGGVHCIAKATQNRLAISCSIFPWQRCSVGLGKLLHRCPALFVPQRSLRGVAAQLAWPTHKWFLE